MMTNKKENNTPPKKTTESEADLERLDKNERLAFEKIMGEIEETDKTISSVHNDQGNRADDKAPPTTDSNATDTERPSEELDDEQQAALDKIMNEINGDAPDDPPAADSKSTEPDATTDELDDDQQAALDKIMNEINGDAPDDPPAADSKSTEPDATTDALDDEQQAALDKIMNEINGDAPDDPPAADSKSTEPDATTDALDDEQQAALDKIMNEINGDAPDDPPAADSKSTEPDATTDALDDDQQAALDKIMNEINGDAPDDPPAADSKSTEPDATTDALDDDQQAALDKIMNEINGENEEDDTSDNSTAFEPQAVSPNTQEIEDNPSSKDGAIEDDPKEKNRTAEKTTLSLEEFDDELNSLLSEVATQKKASDSFASSMSRFKASMKGPDKSAKKEVEISQETSTKASSVQDEKEGQTVPDSQPDKAEDYAILHEVTVSENTDTKKTNKRPPKKVRNKKGNRHKKVTWYTVAVLLLVGICGTAYWRYDLSHKKSVQTPLLPTASTSELLSSTQDGSEKPLGLQAQATATPPLSAIPQTGRTSNAQAAPSLNALVNDITETRKYVLNKITEIKELKTYYQNGVLEEYAKMKLATTTSKISSFKAALRDKPTELSLRAVQRREVYITKLDIPIKQLTSDSEELLYLERKTRIFATLNQGISDLAIPEFKKEVSAIISQHLKSSNELSIDHINVNPPSLESIWSSFQSQTAKKSTKPHNPNSDQDKRINREICNGNYDRKYLVTQLTSKSATCIAQWSGKDLYLNGLSTLPPSVAKTIAQWPGEWLSLNGLKALSPESAKHLAQWKGKRLSLNGLTKLNQRATEYLSQWNGEQLEMVGLKAIGRWENYGTRLFLSEHLRKKLQIQ